MGIFLSLLLVSSALLIDLADNRVANSFKFLQLFIILLFFSIRVTIKPFLSHFQSILNLGLLILTQFISQLLRILNSILHTVDIIFKRIFGVNFFLLELILISKSFSILQHLFDFFLGKSSLIIGNHNLFALIGRFISGTNL